MARTLVVPVQLLIGGLAWFVVFGITYHSVAWSRNECLAIFFAVSASFISSGGWALSSSMPLLLPSSVYSLAFWGWVLLSTLGGVPWTLNGMVFWIGLAASVHLSGLLGTWIAFGVRGSRGVRGSGGRVPTENPGRDATSDDAG